MQIYIENNLIYSFDRQKTLMARYLIGNTRSSQKHRRYDENNIEQDSLLLTKSKFDKIFFIVSFQQKDKA